MVSLPNRRGPASCCTSLPELGAASAEGASLEDGAGPGCSCCWGCCWPPARDAGAMSDSSAGGRQQGGTGLSRGAAAGRPRRGRASARGHALPQTPHRPPCRVPPPPGTPAAPAPPPGRCPGPAPCRSPSICDECCRLSGCPKAAAPAAPPSSRGESGRPRRCFVFAAAGPGGGVSVRC